jgi:hypothetical protein
MERPPVLDCKIYRRGEVVRKRSYYKGAHEHIGKIVNGYTGVETIVDEPIVQAVKVITIYRG